MIPLRSSERTFSPATVTVTLIVINLAVFFYELELRPWQLNRFIAAYGILPLRFHYSQLITSMFLHGGWLHVLGNMWFLWIYGKGIEDALGHVRFAMFYLLCGIAAGCVQLAANLGSPIPTVGASGAIAGVMGAYLIKFPRARIVTLVPVFVFLTTFDIPAGFLLLYWFAIQFFSGIVAPVGYSQVSAQNVAWFAHVGGFVAGMLLILVMPTRQRFRPWS